MAVGCLPLRRSRAPPGNRRWRSIVVAMVSNSEMTQQYVVGQFSVLLGELEEAAAEQRSSVHSLRREVELSPLTRLPELADEVMELADAICWSALQRGDVKRFSSCARSAAELGEFVDSAGLSHATTEVN